MGVLAQILFGISPREVDFGHRGFPGADEPTRSHLEEIARAFVAGYTAALADDRLEPLAAALDQTPRERLGFAYEGAAMALGLLDFAQPWRRRRLAAFIAGPAEVHRYLALIGAGWAIARLPVRWRPAVERLDPLLRWLALDGWGFHQGFFHWRETIARGERPKSLDGYARRAFDQGVGRSLWFVEAAHPEKIAGRIHALAPERRGDLWSGVGLASAYAGGVDRATLERLARGSGEHLPAVAQGIAFAAKTRAEAGNVTLRTELACEVIWKRNAAQIAELTDRFGTDLPHRDDPPDYEVWRARVQDHFLRERAAPWLHPEASSAATA